jgi:hypothetical protein
MRQIVLLEEHQDANLETKTVMGVSRGTRTMKIWGRVPNPSRVVLECQSSILYKKDRRILFEHYFGSPSNGILMLQHRQRATLHLELGVAV